MTTRRIVRCNACLQMAENDDGLINARTAEAAREQANAVGWRSWRSTDICPDCQADVESDDSENHPSLAGDVS